MDVEEIRASVLEARRACAAAIAPGEPRKAADVQVIAQLIATLGRLADATEALLAEREAFAGRLRRSSTRPAEPEQPRTIGGSIDEVDGAARADADAPLEAATPSRPPSA